MKVISTIKTISFILLFITTFCMHAKATIFPVTVASNTFTPATIPNVIVGDTIRWTWVSGFHTTTCDPTADNATSLPAGAAAWDAPMFTGSRTFEYKVTVAGVYNYLCTPHRSFMTASFTASEPLPVQLSRFQISNVNNSAVLNWVTESEDNIDYFSVQKSKTGSGFSEIARVPAAGHSTSTKSYQYTDANPSSLDKYYYYTIVAVDKDGKRASSPVELFKNKINITKLVISLSPNPINRSGHLMLKFNADKPSKMEVKVVNIEGRTVLETTLQAYEGVNSGHVMLDKISAGSYSITFELNGIKEVHKLLVN